MARSMPSEQVQLLIAGYVLGELEPEEAAEFEQLLQRDPAIAQEIAQMQKALEVSHGIEEIPPPVHLREAILTAHAAEQRPPIQPAPVPPRRRPQPSSWGRWAGVAAAALIVGLGITNYRLWRRVQTLEATTPPTSVVTYSLTGSQPNQAASVSLTVNPNTLEAELLAQNLPPLPPGKVYALWTVLPENAPVTVDDKSAVLTETFSVDPSGKVVRRFTVPPIYRSQELIQRVAISVEDAAAPQAHRGTPILSTKL